MRSILPIPKPKLGLVILHVLLWMAFLFLPFILYRITIVDKSFYFDRTINNLLLIALFYFHYYYLLPKFFVKNRLTTYILIVVGCTIVFTLLQMAINFYFLDNHLPPLGNRAFIFSANTSGPKFPDSLRFFKPGTAGAPPPGPFFVQHFDNTGMFWVRPFMNTFPSVVIIMVLGGFIRVATRWFESEKQKEVLEIEKLNAELDFLKSQVNPHFLFNSLNTIYALAHKQSMQTEVATLKLSQILRYVIYEASAPFIHVTKEVGYMEDYIELQKYRVDKNCTISYNCRGVAGNLIITPMLLVPFIENAFKHGVSYKPGSFIDISIYTMQSTLYFMVINSYAKKAPGHSSGIGMLNVQRRLQLSYEGKHDLSIIDANGVYTVNLQIQLQHDKLPVT